MGGERVATCMQHCAGRASLTLRAKCMDICAYIFQPFHSAFHGPFRIPAQSIDAMANIMGGRAYLADLLSVFVLFVRHDERSGGVSIERRDAYIEERVQWRLEVQKKTYARCAW